MFKYLLLSVLLSTSSGLPNKQKNCCITHHKRKSNDLTSANYECSQLTPFGKERCVNVLGGNVCKWGNCPQLGGCYRFPNYELHFGKNIDVGKCAGICKKKHTIDSVSDNVIISDSVSDNVIISDSVSNIDSEISLDKPIYKPSQTCSPSVFDYKELKNKKVKIISECECQDCGVKNSYGVVKIPQGRCVGECEERSNVCYAGVRDNYSQLNGLEVSSPSLPLLTSAAGICSLGVQPGFDIFIDNRCFVHTFENCIRESSCPIKTLSLDICMEAAQVSLTNTDSLRLGTNGVGLWGVSLPVLNGGGWNPGDNLCVTLDLNNLQSGVSILNNVIIDGHLDVLVQDDTAVDFLKLTTIYHNCEKCLPVEHTVYSLYTGFGLQQHRHIRDCDCLDVRKCHRERLEETFHTGTDYEVTLDVGQCLGKCDTGSLCNKEVSLKKIKSPYGGENVEIIEGCFC